MAVPWSRLHEVLGTEPRVLAYADVVEAVLRQVREDDALDWKAERRVDEHAKVELAKDVAAMANSGGGVLVFGVAGDGTEKRLVVRDIELAEQSEHQIRAVVWERVRPLILGIDVLPLPIRRRPAAASLKRLPSTSRRSSQAARSPRPPLLGATPTGLVLS